MRKLIYYEAVSVDGGIADPGGGCDDFLVEGDHMPWIIEHYASRSIRSSSARASRWWRGRRAGRSRWR